MDRCVKSYCMFISYFGQFYRGSQIQPEAVRSVHKVYEGALQHCFQKKLPEDHNLRIRLASRTDVGVHALKNALSFQLPSSINLRYKLKDLKTYINRYLLKHHEGTRVSYITVTADGFDVLRSAISKTYMYRLLLLTSEEHSLIRNYSVNIIDKDFLHVIVSCDMFDIKLFEQAACMLSGVNDYSLFRTVPKLPKETEKYLFTRVVRSCDITIEAGSPHAMARYTPLSNLGQYINVRVQGRGFMHKQVRYMVGCMIEVATGRISMERLEEMLAHPERGLSHNELRVAPSKGLYLVDIHYPDDAFTASNPQTIQSDQE